MGNEALERDGSDYEPKDAAIEPTLSSGFGEVDVAGTHQLERGLKSRHIQFLALGGAIGTGLFVGSGAILSLVGPAPLFMGYLSMMFVVWVVMNDLAEMVTYLPMRGISLPYFVGRFVDPSLAFADGWYAAWKRTTMPQDSPLTLSPQELLVRIRHLGSS